MIGRPRPLPLWKRILGYKSVAEELIQRAQGISITVIDAEYEEQGTKEFVEPTSTRPATPTDRPAGALRRLLTPDRIIIWEDAVSKRDIRENLVKAITSTTPGLKPDIVLKKLIEREEQGSTFLNEGIALPHARIDTLDTPQIALGLTHGGVLDVPTDRPDRGDLPAPFPGNRSQRPFTTPGQSRPRLSKPRASQNTKHGANRSRST